MNDRFLRVSVFVRKITQAHLSPESAADHAVIVYDHDADGVLLTHLSAFQTTVIRVP